MTDMRLLTQVHLADLHFSAFNPRNQYEILKEQCFDLIAQIPSIDVISVDGDFFDHKITVMASFVQCFKSYSHASEAPRELYKMRVPVPPRDS